MDLVLLQFGDNSFQNSSIDGFVGVDNWQAVTNSVGDANFDLNKCVELISMTQGIKQQLTTDVSNSARTSGHPVVSDFTCVKYVDAASPKMYDYCLRAKPLDSDIAHPTKIFILRNSGKQLNVIMQFELRLAMISELQFQSHPNDMATEQFKLNFTELLWQHQPQDSSIGNNDALTTGWSTSKNRPINTLTD